MTPQEQALVNELFDRLAKLESSSRDRDAERLIADGMRQAPQEGLVSGRRQSDRNAAAP
jgi:hypothetical protein